MLSLAQYTTGHGHENIVTCGPHRKWQRVCCSVCNGYSWQLTAHAHTACRSCSSSPCCGISGTGSASDPRIARSWKRSSAAAPPLSCAQAVSRHVHKHNRCVWCRLWGWLACTFRAEALLLKTFGYGAGVSCDGAECRGGVSEEPKRFCAHGHSAGRRCAAPSSIMWLPFWPTIATGSQSNVDWLVMSADLLPAFAFGQR